MTESKELHHVIKLEPDESQRTIVDDANVGSASVDCVKHEPEGQWKPYLEGNDSQLPEHDLEDSKYIIEQFIDESGMIWDRKLFLSENINHFVKVEEDKHTLEDDANDTDRSKLTYSPTINNNLTDNPHVKITTHQCDFCPYNTNKKSDFKRHVTTVHLKVRNHKCTLCDYSAANKTRLNDHVFAIHSKIRKCTLCHYSCVKESDFNEHLNSLHSNEIQQCELCDNAIILKDSLEDHLTTVHHGGSNQRNTIRLDDSHQKKSDDGKVMTHKCHLCDYVTDRKNNCKRHMDAVHLKLKYFKCHLCEYGALKKCYIVNHVNDIHLKLKKYKCEFCEYSATRTNTLKNHINVVHLKVKSFKCPLCELRTSTKSHLNSHINAIHLKVKTHKCYLCEYSVTRKSRLVKHMRTVHLEIK